jgi:hypothetical protein
MRFRPGRVLGLRGQPNSDRVFAVEPAMNERLETLKKARERMIEDRDAHAKVLAAPFDRDKAERARNKFIETQMVIDAIERAISAEERISPTG